MTLLACDSKIWRTFGQDTPGYLLSSSGFIYLLAFRCFFYVSAYGETLQTSRFLVLEKFGIVLLRSVHFSAHLLLEHTRGREWQVACSDLLFSLISMVAYFHLSLSISYSSRAEPATSVDATSAMYIKITLIFAFYLNEMLSLLSASSTVESPFSFGMPHRAAI
jgi:hypothetical protein